MTSASRNAARRRVGAYTVGDAVRDYLEHSEGRPSGRDLSHTFRTHVLPAFGDTPVADLTADAIRKWHRDIAATAARTRTAPGAEQNYRSLDDPEAVRRRQSSANLCLTKLRAALNHAWREGKVELGGWQRVQPFRGVNVARARFLTIAESQRLINACEGDFRDLVRAALLTGCRYQEIARLRVSDFNPDNGSLHIRKSKSGKDRHVILTEEGAEFFSQLTAGRDGEDLILRRAWRPGDQSYLFAQTCKRAGIKGASFHTLRHTWASLAVMAGVPLMVVAKNLGHANTRMVDMHYGHLADDFVADAIRNGAPRFGKFEGDREGDAPCLIGSKRPSDAPGMVTQWPPPWCFASSSPAHLRVSGMVATRCAHARRLGGRFPN